MIKKISLLILIFCVFSCAEKKENPLILPPNFAEMPDPNKPEKPLNNQQQQEANVARLKELLLKSETDER